MAGFGNHYFRTNKTAKLLPFRMTLEAGMRIATLADKIAVEQEMPLEARWSARRL